MFCSSMYILKSHSSCAGPCSITQILLSARIPKLSCRQNPADGMENGETRYKRDKKRMNEEK